MGLFDAIFGLAGAGVQAGTAKALQEDAQQFQTEFYKQRYQRQMEDMRAAGLNPILSYRTGVPGTASGGIASAAGVGSAIADIPSKMAAGKQARAAKTQATSAKGVRGLQETLVKQQIDTEEYKQAHLRDQANNQVAQKNLTDVNTALETSKLPKAQHVGDFYSSKAGRPAVITQEAAGTARKVRSVIIGGP